MREESEKGEESEKREEREERNERGERGESERERERARDRTKREKERASEGRNEGRRESEGQREREREGKESKRRVSCRQRGLALPPKMSKDVRTIWVVPEASTGQAGTAAAAVPLLVVAPSLFASPPKFLAFQIEIVKQKSTFPSYG
jgi:hypothetical protein